MVRREGDGGFHRLTEVQRRKHSMENEGILVSTSWTLVKDEMIRAIRELGSGTPDEWERAVFKRLTGQDRDDVDFDVEDNQAGYFLWLKTFDTLVAELVEDGYVATEDGTDGAAARIVARESDPSLAWNRLVYPSKDGD
jgi:hypothetical protein